MNTKPTESVIRKIQNLLAMAERAKGNEAEAALAMDLAQQMLTKYNLDMHTVGSTHVAGGTVEEKREKVKLSKYSAMYQWQQDLWKAIAEANFCVHFVRTVTENHHVAKNVVVTAKRHVILGSETNVLAVQIMGDYLLETMARLLPYERKEQMSKAANSWRVGCVERIVARIEEKSARMKAGDTTNEDGTVSSALAVRNVWEAEKAANYDAQYGKGTYAASCARAAKWEADYAAGQEERAAQRERLMAEEAAKLLAETPAAKAVREKREAKQNAKDDAANERWARGYYARQAREAAKLDGTAYYAGKQAGNTVGLDSQVGAGAPTKRIG